MRLLLGGSSTRRVAGPHTTRHGVGFGSVHISLSGTLRALLLVTGEVARSCGLALFGLLLLASRGGTGGGGRSNRIRLIASSNLQNL
mgnify:CR=1 FL=1